MSEFEKWFWTDFDPDDGDYSKEIYIKVKQGWIAALDWILTKSFHDAFEDLHCWEKRISSNDKKVIAASDIVKEIKANE